MRKDIFSRVKLHSELNVRKHYTQYTAKNRRAGIRLTGFLVAIFIFAFAATMGGMSVNLPNFNNLGETVNNAQTPVAQAASAYAATALADWQALIGGSSTTVSFDMADDWIADGNFGTKSNADGISRYRLYIPSGYKVTIDLKGHTLSRGCTSATTYGGVFYVEGELIINDSVGGGKITGGWTSTSGTAGAISTAGNGVAKVTLNGGEITGNISSYSNTASGVVVQAGDTFIMNGGKITAGGFGTSTSYGGVYVYGGKFTMNGGEISGNSASAMGGGVTIADNGTFTLTDGKISENTSKGRSAGGVYASSGKFTMEGGEISGNSVSSASNYSAGAVSVSSCNVKISGGLIDNNKQLTTSSSYSAGALMLDSSTLTMTGGTISNNENASNVRSGGAIFSNAGPIQIQGGRIIGNKAQTGGQTNVNYQTAGGIYLTDGRLEITGGEISNNIGEFSGGIRPFVDTYWGGNPVVYGNHTIDGEPSDVNPNNSYELKLQIISKLTAGAKIGIEGSTSWFSGLGSGYFTNGYRTYNKMEDPAQYFTASNPKKYAIIPYKYNSTSYEVTVESRVSDMNWIRAVGMEGERTVKLYDDWVADENGRFGTGTGFTSTGGLDTGANDGLFTLDLNGHTIDRNLTGKAAVANGSVIYAHCNFRIIDSSGTAKGTIKGGNSNDVGGGIRTTYMLTVENVTVCDNSTTKIGGGIYASNELNLRNVTIKDNYSGSYGGGVGMEGGRILKVEGNTLITKNNALRLGGGIYYVSVNDSSGGAVTMTTGVRITDNVVRNESTSVVQGGGIYVGGNTQFKLTGVAVTGNSMTGTGTGVPSGGGISIADGSVTAIITDCTVSNNTGFRNGGGIYNSTGNTQISGGTVANNSATLNGGGIYNSSGVLTLKNVAITGNTADNFGGGIYNVGGEHAWDGITVSGNTAAKHGGGIYNQSSTLRLSNHTIERNDATECGGGIAMHAGEITFSSGTIAANTAKNGAGIYRGVDNNSVGTLTITGGSIVNNVASVSAGGIGTYKSATLQLGGNPTITGNTAAGEPYDIQQFNKNDRFEIISKLTNTVPIGIYREELDVFTSNYSSYNRGIDPADLFVAQFVDRFVRLDSASGEVAIALDDPGDLWRVAVHDSINTGKQATVTLKKDWLASANSSYGTAFGTDSTAFYNGALRVPTGADVVLDLNGKTINRNLTTKRSSGVVVYICGGKFTLIDSSTAQTGKLTGGKNQYPSSTSSFSTQSAAGGVAISSGTFDMQGGTITGNEAEGTGSSTGGVVINSGTFRMTGGVITGNVGQGAGGVYAVYPDACTVELGGDARIEGNHTTEGLDRDLRLKDNIGDYKPKVVSLFTSKARIGMYFYADNYKKKSEGGLDTTYNLLTDGYSAKGNTADPSTVFFSNDSDYRVVSETVNKKTEAKMLCIDPYKSWADLYNNYESGKKYDFPLYRDWIAQYDSSYTTKFSSKGTTNGGITVGAGWDVTIDLCGYTIDRGLTVARASGYVFRIEGTLTVVDSSVKKTGKITGGNNTGAGGGFYIIGGAKLVLLGGKVTENYAEQGGGVYVLKATSYLGYGGDAWVTGNKSTTGAVSNIFFATTNLLHIEEDLWNKPTGITTPGNGTITDGFYNATGGANPAQYFYSENPDFYGVKGGDGELFFLSMNNDTNWQYAVDTSKANNGRWETVVLAGDWTANATSSSTSFGTTTAYTSGQLYVPATAKIILDLAGYTLDRGLKTETSYGGVIWVEGQLTIMDSSENGTGKITGAYSNANAYGAITIRDGGTVIMQGGSVTGNKASNSHIGAGGVNVNDGGKFTLQNASVVNNEGGTAGIRVYPNGIFNVGGKAVVSGNTRTNGVTTPTPRDTYFDELSDKINVVSALTAGAHIGIQRDINSYVSNNGNVVTSGYGRYNSEPASTYFFASDDPAHKIIDGKGSNNSLEAALFCYDNMMNWNNAVAQSVNDGKEKTVTLYHNWTAESNSSLGTAFSTTGSGVSNGSLWVPSGARIKLDLNGYTIDRDIQRLSTVYDFGMVIRVRGYLHIIDSVGSGVITGGRVKGDNLNNITYGAGIHVQDSAELVLEGGTITHNQGAGVYVSTTGKFGLGGKTVVKDNKFDFSASAPNYDIFLLTITQEIEIVSQLTGGEMFGVTRTKPSDTKIANGVLTKNYGLYNSKLPTEVFYFGDKEQADGSKVDARYFIVDQGDEGDPDTEAALLSNDPAQNWEYAVRTSENYGKTMTVTLREDWIALPNTTGFGTARGFITGSLYVPVDAKIILNLNGHTVDRNLATTNIVANVFYIRGELTIIDSKGGGVMKGGNGGSTSSNWLGGGISIYSGSVTMKGGTLTGNKTTYSGRGAGGVYVGGGATFTMTGGTITGNYGTAHAGVYANLDSTINLGGTAQIYDNFLTDTAGNSLGTQSNLYMYQDMQTFNIVEPFVSTTRAAGAIGITADVKLLNATGNCYSNGWTKQMAGSTPNSVFFSDQPDDYVVVSFPKGKDIEVGLYSIDNEANWSSAVRNSLDSGETQTFRLYANWNAKPQYGYAYNVFGTKTGFNSGIMYVPSGASIILDLNGFNIDRKLDMARANGQLFLVDGELTIIDSTAHMEGGEIVQGKIMGGNSTGYSGAIYLRGSLNLLGGTFTGNTGLRGGAVWAASGAELAMGGTVQFYENYSTEGGRRLSDIEIRNDELIEITEAMTFSENEATNKIYYSRYKTYLGNVTQGWGKYNPDIDPADHFVASNDVDFWVTSVGKGTKREAVFLRNRNPDNWEYAVSKSLELGITMPFKLVDDWVATDIGDGRYYNTRFGNKSAYYNGALYVPEDASIVIDLNGYTLDRNHKATYDSRYAAYNAVIIVSGRLQIVDTSSNQGGTIKGGSYGVYMMGEWDGEEYVGGGRVVVGKAVLQEGETDDGTIVYETVGAGKISGNSRYGIYVEAGSLTVTAGNITGNDYADVYVNKNGKLSLGGSARIRTANRSRGASLRLVHELATIDIVDAFVDGAEIGYSRESVGVVTNGWGKFQGEIDPLGVFKSEESGDYNLTLKQVNNTWEVYSISYNNAINWQYAVSKSLEQNGATQRFDLSSCWKSSTAGSFGTTSAFLDGALYVPAGASVILNLNGHELKRLLNNARSNGFVIRVDGELTIIDTQMPEDGVIFQPTTCCTKQSDGSRPGGLITGGYNSNGSSAGGIHISSGGKCTIEAGQIASNRATSASASAGGIYNAGTLVMKGGQIVSNVGKNAGGVYNVGTFTMTAGENASYAEINNNTASEAVSAGGVFTAGTFNFVSGKITVNTGSVGGVYVASNGRFTMGTENGATVDQPAPELNENKGDANTGAVFVASGSYFVLNDGVINKNRGAFAGAVYSAGTTTMRGGSITNNEATTNLAKADTAGGAGGIYVAGGGSLTMTDGEISANKGFSGVRIYSSGSLKLGGAAKIYNNTTADSSLSTNDTNHVDVYFNTATKRLSVASTFDKGDNGANIGIYREQSGIFTTNYGYYNTELPNEFFHSNNINYLAVSKAVASEDRYSEAFVGSPIPVEPKVVKIEDDQNPKYNGAFQNIIIDYITDYVTAELNGSGMQFDDVDNPTSVQAKNVGRYSVRFTPKGEYCWEDGTTGPKTIYANIDPKPVQLVWSVTDAQHSGDCVYNGTTKHKPSASVADGELEGTDVCTVTLIEGEQIIAGTHTARAVSLSNANYTVAEESATYEYEIKRAERGDVFKVTTESVPFKQWTQISVTGNLENGELSYAVVDENEAEFDENGRLYAKVFEVDGGGNPSRKVKIKVTAGQTANYNATEIEAEILVTKSKLVTTLKETELTYGYDHQLELKDYVEAEMGTPVFSFKDASAAAQYAELTASGVLTAKKVGKVIVHVYIAETNYYLETDDLDVEVTIVPRMLTLDWGETLTTDYTGDEQSPSFTYSGEIKSGDTVNVSAYAAGVSGWEAAQKPAAWTDAGRYTVGIVIDNENYALATSAEYYPTFIINKVKPDFKLLPESGELSYNIPTDLSVENNLGNGRVIYTVFAANSSYYELRGNKLTGKSVGKTISVTAVIAETTNYYGGSVSCTYEIKEAKLELGLEETEVVYGKTLNLVVTGNVANAPITLSYTAGTDGGTAELNATAKTLKGTHVGKVTITIHADATEYYKESECDVEVTVVPRPVTVVWGEIGPYTYDGVTAWKPTEYPSLAIEGGQLLEGDGAPTITGILTGTLDENGKFVECDAVNAGTYYAQAVMTDPNYVGSPLKEFTVKPVTVILTWQENAEFIYNGTEQVPTATVSNLIGDDACTVTVKGTKNAGVGLIAMAVELDNTNYTLDGCTTLTGTYTIKPKPVGITWGETELTYTGFPQAPEAKVAEEDLEEGDTCTVMVLGAQTNVGENYVATAYAPTNPNYTLKEGDYTTLFSIKRADLETELAEKTATYGTVYVLTLTVNPERAQISYRILSGADYVQAGSDSTRLNPVNVGTVTVEVTLGQTENYNEKVFTEEITILPRPVSITWNNLEFEYDKRTHNPIASLANAVNGDLVELTLSDPQTFAGTHTATVTKVSNNRYTIEDGQNISQSFTIKPRPVTITWGNTDLAYNGQMQHPTVTLGNIVSGDVCEAEVEGSVNAGVRLTATVKSLSNPNYTLEGVLNTSVRYNIAQTKAVLKWGETTLYYTGEPQAPEVTVTNLWGDDVCEVTVSGKEIDAGTYTATVTSLSNPNYTLEGVENLEMEFVIKKAPVELTLSQTSVMYGEEMPIIVLGIPENANATITLLSGGTGRASLSAAKDVLKAEKAGEVTLRVTVPESDNYEAGDSNIIVTITPRPIEVEWTYDEDGYIYDGTEKKPVATIVNLLDGDECDAEVTGAVNASNAAVASVTAVSNSNYTYENGINVTTTFAIAARFLEIEWEDTEEEPEFKFNGQQQGPKARIKATALTFDSGLIAGDECEVLYSGWNVDVGSYTATAVGLTNSNYVLDGEPEDLQKKYKIIPVKPVITLHPETVKVGESTTLYVDGNIGNGAVTYYIVDGSNLAEIWGDQLVAYKVGTVTVRAVVGETLNTEGAEVTATITIEKGKAALELEYDKVAYGGTLELTISDNNGTLDTSLLGAITYTLAAGFEDWGTVTKKDGKDVFTALKAGIVKINIHMDGTANFDPTDVEAEIEVTPRTVTLEWTVADKYTYNKTPQGPTATVTNLLGNDAVKVTVEWATDAGTQTAVAKSLDNDNYTLVRAEDTTKEYVISPKPLDLTWDEDSLKVVYNGKEQVPHAILSVIEEGDTCEATFESTFINAGRYDAKATGVTNSNYCLTGHYITPFEIEKATLNPSFVNDTVAFHETIELLLKEEFTKGFTTYEILRSGVGGDGDISIEHGEDYDKYMFYATRMGEVDIKVTIAGDTNWYPYEGVLKLTVNRAPRELEFISETTVMAGDDLDLKISGNENEPGEVVYTILRTSSSAQTSTTNANFVGMSGTLATVAGNVLKAKHVGTVTLRVTVKQTANYAETTIDEVTINIVKRTVEINWGETVLQYNGKEQMPTYELVKGNVDGTINLVATGKQTNVGIYTGNDTAKVTGVKTTIGAYLSSLGFTVRQYLEYRGYEYSPLTEDDGRYYNPVTHDVEYLYYVTNRVINHPDFDTEGAGVNKETDFEIERARLDLEILTTHARVDELVELEVSGANDNTVKFEVTNGTGTAILQDDGVHMLPKTVGTVLVTASVEESENYYAASVTGLIIIEKSLPKITLVQDTVEYGEDLILAVNGSLEGGTVTFAAANDSGAGILTGALLHTTRAGIVKITVTVSETENYAQFMDVFDVTITPRRVELRWSKFEFTYNGIDDFAPTATVRGLINGDECTVDVGGRQMNAGNYAAGTAKAIGLSNPNYTLEGVDCDAPSFVVNKAKIEISLATTAITLGEPTKILVNGNKGNGDVLVSVENGTGEATANGDTVTGTKLGQITVNVTVQESENYLSASTSGTILVEKPAVPVDLEVKTLMYGDTLTLSVVDNLEGGAVRFEVANDTGSATLNGSNLTATGVGEVVVTIIVAETKTYKETRKEVTVTITKRIVEISWVYPDLVYDGTVKTPTAVVSNLVEGDTCGVEVGADEGTGIHAGEGHRAYVISLEDTDKYQLPEEGIETTYTILPRPVSLDWTLAEKYVYNAEEQAPTATVNNKVGDDSVTVTVKGVKDAGVDVIAEAIETDNSDYTVDGGENIQKTFTIEPYLVDVQWEGTRVTYTGKAVGPKAFAVGTLNGEVCEAEVEGDGINAGGPYTATVTGLKNPNYKFVGEASTEYYIDPVVLTMESEGWTKEYNGQFQSPTITLNGVVEGEDIGIRALDENLLDSFEEVGTYTLTLTIVGNSNTDNYTLGENGTTRDFVITKKKVTIKVVAGSVSAPYNNGNAVTLPSSWYTLVADGFLGEEDIAATFGDFAGILNITPNFRDVSNVVMSQVTERGTYTLIPVVATIGTLPESDHYIAVIDEEVGEGLLTVGAKDLVALSSESTYRFLFEEVDEYGWVYRTTYAEKNYVHGVDDTAFERSVLGEIAPNTTINTFLSNFMDLTKLTLYDNFGNIVFTAGALYGDFADRGDSTDYSVGTGWRMENGAEETMDIVYLSVLGDLDGDGKITYDGDVEVLIAFAREFVELTAEFRLAAYIGNFGFVGATDISIIMCLLHDDNAGEITKYYYNSVL